ncbi:MAG: DUF58 domain-containing protein [Methylococcaceae bacterium]|nr:DUF58 domain-containing protein [Methylococcaceae bacterium]MDD1608244.1 DUF58 domain-containing protein [Methylococcaceae bacterium]MDD1609315.1 DUF58 domain-containing protein [Methylococcaceae bacterium]MDD1615170.1 DUF58 domain-containing protein [Methylococcaceae bacterium]OYV21023.1 MAG: hypothetical protein CG439_248 [Methylococcaceae bacterium NSP1-2]
MLKKSTVATSERVFVSLKTLIDLAKPAAGLNLKRLSIHAPQSGGYISPIKGRGMEFEETRMYQPGDDIRSIDWRVTARTGKTHTKVFREERERPVFISVDNRSAMHFATRGVFKSVLAAKLAALLAWAAQHQGDRIGGQLFSELACCELKPQNGRHAVLRFLNMLVREDNVNKAATSMTLEHVLARLVQHAHPGSLVYIISDFRGINDAAELHLVKLAQHCQVVLIFVYDALESNLPTKGRYRFTDGQQDVVIDTSDSQRVETYHQHFEQRLQRLQQLAKKRGLSFIQCSTVDDPIQCLR